MSVLPLVCTCEMFFHLFIGKDSYYWNKYELYNSVSLNFRYSNPTHLFKLNMSSLIDFNLFKVA